MVGTADFNSAEARSLLLQIDQSIISASAIPLIPKDVVKVNEVSDKSRLTQAQWGYGHNLEGAKISEYSAAHSALQQRFVGTQLTLSEGDVQYSQNAVTNTAVDGTKTTR